MTLDPMSVLVARRPTLDVPVVARLLRMDKDGAYDLARRSADGDTTSPIPAVRLSRRRIVVKTRAFCEAWGIDADALALVLSEEQQA